MVPAVCEMIVKKAFLHSLLFIQWDDLLLPNLSLIFIKILSPSHWHQRKEAQQKSLRPLHHRPIGVPRVAIKRPIDPSR
jgi:hypothetical protein